MSGFTWDLQEELRRIEDRMNRMLGESQGRLSGRRISEVPNVDVQEHGNDIIVTADMPGVDKDDIKINVRDGNILEISAQKKTEMERKEERLHPARARLYRVLPLDNAAGIRGPLESQREVQ